MAQLATALQLGKGVKDALQTVQQLLKVLLSTPACNCAPLAYICAHAACRSSTAGPPQATACSRLSAQAAGGRPLTRSRRWVRIGRAAQRGQQVFCLGSSGQETPAGGRPSAAAGWPAPSFCPSTQQRAVRLQLYHATLICRRQRRGAAAPPVLLHGVCLQGALPPVLVWGLPRVMNGQAVAGLPPACVTCETRPPVFQN